MAPQIRSTCAALLIAVGGAAAQESVPAPAPPPATAKAPALRDKPQDFLKLGNQASDAFAQRDFAAAAALLERQIALQPENGACWYNLALARGNLGEHDLAVDALTSAVERGFTDRARILREPSFRGLRDMDGFVRIRDHWPEVVAAASERVLNQCRQEFGDTLREERDEELRVIFLSAADASLVSRAREEMHAVQRLARSIFGPIEAGADEEPWVVIVLPNRKGFEKWAAGTFGENARGSFNQIGGTYEHSRKRLVAIDLGATLRHEFFHVIQFRELERLGQQHPIWIMEGLASIVEDMEFPPAPAAPRPIPSWRTNIAQRMERAGALPTLAQLGAMDQLKFSSQRPLGNYAASRNVFMFLASQHKLADWWRVYTTDLEHGLRADESGVRAMEQVLGKPATQIDKDIRVWLRTLSPVAESIEPGMASLGVEVEAGLGEGPIVARVVPGPRGKTHHSAPGVRPGDTLLSIDGKPTRDLAELVRVLGTYVPGNEVLLEVRRGEVIKEFRVTLVQR